MISYQDSWYVYEQWYVKKCIEKNETPAPYTVFLGLYSETEIKEALNVLMKDEDTRK